MNWKRLGIIVAIGGAAGFLGVLAMASVLDNAAGEKSLAAPEATPSIT